jgi:hypothetical protein
MVSTGTIQFSVQQSIHLVCGLMGKYENPWNPSVKQIPILINYKKIDQRKRPCKFITCVLSIVCTIAWH